MRTTTKKGAIPLVDAVQDALRGRWRSIRSRASAHSQANQAVSILAEFEVHYAEQVTHVHLRRLCDISLERGAAPSTVKHRLCCLSVLGVNCTGFSFRVPKTRKWFLKPEDEARMSLTPDLHPEALDFFAFVPATGLRIEEALRVRARDISSTVLQMPTGPKEAFILAVDGTKTQGSAATIVLSEEAMVVVRRRGWPEKLGPEDLLFRWTYDGLRAEWNKVRKFLGAKNIPTATLKNLRRAFARRATLKGMPPDVLRQYLRHSDLKTTQSYLDLIGGYSHAEQARFL